MRILDPVGNVIIHAAIKYVVKACIHNAVTTEFIAIVAEFESVSSSKYVFSPIIS